MTLDHLRTFFPHTDHTVYLNHAATGPLSTRVMDAMQAFLAERHGDDIENYEAVMPVLEESQARFAEVIGTTVERVAHAPNTSYALNVLAEGLDWQPGDRIAVPACEFPANVYPFMNQARKGVAVDFIPHHDGVVRLEDLEATLTPQTRLLTISWVQFLSGFRADLEAIGKLCKERAIIFCVDAIQGLGACRLDVEQCGIDFLATGGHKWLMGPQGTGFLYVTEELQAQLTPVAGWLHGPIDWEHFFDYELAFHPDARRYMLGTPNSIGFVGMNAALGLYLEADPGWCEEQVLDRAQDLAGRLEAQGFQRYGSADPAHASGIVTVRHPKPEDASVYLKKQGIVASVRNRLLRFAPTYYNSPDEMARTAEVLAAFGKTSIPTGNAS